MHTQTYTTERSLRRAQAYLRAYLREQPYSVNKIALFTACMLDAEQRVRATGQTAVAFS